MVSGQWLNVLAEVLTERPRIKALAENIVWCSQVRHFYTLLVPLTTKVQGMKKVPASHPGQVDSNFQDKQHFTLTCPMRRDKASCLQTK